VLRTEGGFALDGKSPFARTFSIVRVKKGETNVYPGIWVREKKENGEVIKRRLMGISQKKKIKIIPFRVEAEEKLQVEGKRIKEGQKSRTKKMREKENSKRIRIRGKDRNALEKQLYAHCK